MPTFWPAAVRVFAGTVAEVESAATGGWALIVTA